MVQPAKIGALAAPLTIKAEPVADESLVGYLARIANRNGLENPHWLADSLQDTFSTIDVMATRPVDLTIFSQLTRQSQARLRRMAYWPASDGRRVNFLGNRINRELVTVHHRRYCPQCLADKPYHRACWDLSVATVCTVHRTRLLTNCPECGDSVGWVSRSLTHCRCNGDLRTAKADPVPSNEIVALSYITERLTAADEPVGLAGLAPGDELELIYVLGSYARSARRKRPIGLLQSGADMLGILNDGYQALTGLPGSLHEYFAGLRVARRGRYGLAKEVGALAEYATDPETPAAIRRFMHGHLSRYLGASGVGSRAVRPDQLVILKVVVKRLGRSTTRVHDVLKHHKLITASDGRGRGAPVLVHKDVVDRLEAGLNDLIDKTGLRDVLGCSKRGLNVLLAAGWLSDIATGADADLFGRVCWRKTAVLAVLDDLEAAVPTGGSQRDIISMAAAVSMAGYQHIDWTRKSVEKLLSKGVLSRAGVGLARICFPRATLRRGGEERLSIPVATAELKMKQEVVYFLVGKGLLAAGRFVGCRGLRIVRPDLDAFRKEFFVPSQSGLDGIHYPGWTADQLIADGISPVTGPSVDGGRQFIFRRADVLASKNKEIKKVVRA